MSVRRKLFLAISALIIVMGIVHTLILLSAVGGMLHVFLVSDRHEELQAVSEVLEAYYEQNGQSWIGVREAADEWANANPRQDTQLLLLDPERDTLLYSYGNASKEIIRKLGIRHELNVNGSSAAILYYIDLEVLNQAKLRYGLTSSISALLVASTVISTLLSMLVVYVLTRRLTAPLNRLVPAIDRLGRGEWGVQTDVSSKDELGRLAQAFNAMSAQLRRNEELRRNLVADVAHELRTPVTIIQGKLELIQHSGKPADPESLLPIQDELIRLTRLIDDLHLLSRAEAKQLSVERKAVNAIVLLEQVIERVSLDAGNKQQHICRNLPAEAIVIPLDPHRMTQVFLNLLLNAVRYTPEGGTITVSAKREAAALHKLDRSDVHVLSVTISDTGSGIAPDQLPHLFNRFYRTDEARSRHTGGTGLGLAIAQELVLAHGGSIDVESVLGEGTSFVVRLPLNPNDSALV
ncbi:HAMP domain-containing protein [Xylanibacillus composti]|uniref:histidine kinase n=1 Tax=Xylanibacillus composti TaxID=1572762 RepID=A0A8J4M389_9BACL|nr:ATP-binding protein [Xylanibacillus composti]MDT9726328.1 HAMP domain-containing protein [Xylanibacillus composti]GIQ70564.1 two-component sensor histidine kinase [Xylanibacillus composti]